MDGKSLTPEQGKINALKQIMPEIFDEGKIDWEKLCATLGEEVNFSNERYVLNWAGKSEAFRVLQQPSSQTLVPAKEESVDFDSTRNIFIEGENLEVLKVLQKSYFGKVKMIYIDPPYNTGNDSFIYPDKFSESKEEYQQRVGDKDHDGYMTREGMFRKNSKENGQYHSNWLNMMMPRLYLAKNLLREDGVIFISIDDNEVHNLRLLMNEIFGEENFVEIFSWVKTSTPPSLSYKSRKTVEYILCFEIIKNTKKYFGEELDGGDQPLLNTGNKVGTLIIPKEKIKFNLNNGTYTKGTYHKIELLNDIEIVNGVSSKDVEIRGKFKWSQSFLDIEIEKGTTFIVKSDKFSIRFQRFEDEGFKSPANYIQENSYDPILEKNSKGIDTNEKSSSELEKLMNGKYFDFPKPVSLIKYILNFCSNKDDIILDFFAGSATTAHAVMQLNKEDGGNRQFICVQMPELCDENSEAYKAGYKTIAEISKERIRRAGKKIQTEIDAENEKKKGELDFSEAGNCPSEIDLGFKVLKLQDSNFKQWRQVKDNNIEEIEKQMELFIDPVAENATVENMVYELLLKSGKNLNSPIVHKDGYYSISGNELILMLESASEQVVASVLAKHPQKVIALDRLFEGNDQLKTNTALQMKDGKVEFKTI